MQAGCREKQYQQEDQNSELNRISCFFFFFFFCYRIIRFLFFLFNYTQTTGEAVDKLVEYFLSKMKSIPLEAINQWEEILEKGKKMFHNNHQVNTLIRINMNIGYINLGMRCVHTYVRVDSIQQQQYTVVHKHKNVSTSWSIKGFFTLEFLVLKIYN